jgi:type II secretion system protein H
MRGFSLIEMLVVLFVVVLMTSLVSLNVTSGSDERELQGQVEALAAIASYALDEAQFSGSDFGVLFARSVNARGEQTVTAHWRQRLLQGWREPQRSRDIFEPIQFPADTRVQLVLDDVEVLAAEADASDPRAGVVPQWLLVSSGETQPGELLIRRRDSDTLLWRLSWDPLARFQQFRGDSDDALGEGDEGGEYAQAF